MSEHNKAMSEREEIEMLLPWYVSGKLTAAQHRRVEDYLRTHPDMTHQLSLIEGETEASVAGNEAIGGAPAGALDRLLADVAQHERKRVVANLPRRLLAWADGVAGGLMMPKLRWAAAAAAVIIAVQAVAIGVLLVDGPTQSQYKTAAGGETEAAAATGVVALVRFTPEASIGEISPLLENFGASIVAGPMPGSIYRIKIANQDLSDQEAAALIDRFKSSSEKISFAARAPGANKQ